MRVRGFNHPAGLVHMIFDNDGLIAGVPASDETFTVQIPSAEKLNTLQYTIEIIDDTDTNNVNFSPNFLINGVTGTATFTSSARSGSSTGSQRASSTRRSSSVSSSDSVASKTASYTSTTVSNACSSRASASAFASASSVSSSSPSPGVKIRISVAVPVSVILIAVIIAGFLIRRRRRMRLEPRQSQGSQPDNGPVEETQESQEYFETYHKKPELEAEPVVDPTIRGPVTPKFELRSQGTAKAKAITKHIKCGRAPGVGPRIEQQMKQEAKASKTSTTTSTLVPSDSNESPFNQPPLQLFQNISTEASELAEEADVIVQELGLVNLRKKALTTQASAIGKRPDDVEGRKREEFKELLEREVKLKGRLEEIERERQGQEGVT